ncbi:IS110 family transposase [Erysipelotrichaceae bacterium 66-17]
MKKSKAFYSLYVGIDISKGKADAAILQVFPDRSRKDRLLRKKVRIDFSRSSVDEFHQTVLKYADEQCSRIIYAMEDTGIYYRGFYTYLTSLLFKKESVLVLKPSYVSHWCKLHERSKSDPLDAQSITHIIAYERDFKTVNPSFSHEKREYSSLRTETRRYQQIRKMDSQESVRLISLADVHCPELAKVFGTGMTFLKVLSVFPSTYDIIRADKQELLALIQTSSKNHFGQNKLDELLALCEDSLSQQEPAEADRRAIRSLVSHILSLREELSSIRKDLKELCEKIPGYRQLISMPGFGLITASIVLAEIIDISRFKSADALIAYAGTDPVNRRSGSSVHSEGRISRNGSRYLRHAIVMAAEFARRHNPVLAELFNRLKAGQKKRHFLALIAVANKLLRYVYSVLKSNEDFVINFKDLLKLKEETRLTFFQNITTKIPDHSLRSVYRYEDESGEIHPFVYTARYSSQAAMESF